MQQTIKQCTRNGVNIFFWKLCLSTQGTAAFCAIDVCLKTNSIINTKLLLQNTKLLYILQNTKLLYILQNMKLLYILQNTKLLYILQNTKLLYILQNTKLLYMLLIKTITKLTRIIQSLYYAPAGRYINLVQRQCRQRAQYYSSYNKVRICYSYIRKKCIILKIIWIRYSLQASIASTHRHVHVQIVVLGSFLHYS